MFENAILHKKYCISKASFLKLMNVGVLTSPVARKAFIPNLTDNKHKKAQKKEYVYF